MDSTRPKMPAEAIQLYNRFIHFEISRRDFMDGVQRFAVGGLTVAAVVEALMPNYAQGQQVAKNDDRIKASYETVPSPTSWPSPRTGSRRSADSPATIIAVARCSRRSMARR